MGAIDLLNRDMKILIQESYRRGDEITQRNTNFASAMQICDFLFSWRDFITTKVTPSWSTATSVIQNSKFVIQNFPACGSAALGSSAVKNSFMKTISNGDLPITSYLNTMPTLNITSF